MKKIHPAISMAILASVSTVAVTEEATATDYACNSYLLRGGSNQFQSWGEYYPFGMLIGKWAPSRAYGALSVDYQEDREAVTFDLMFGAKGTARLRGYLDVSPGSQSPNIRAQLGPRNLGAGDFDGDGMDDVFISYAGIWYAYSFTERALRRLNSSNVDARSLRFADFNGDGKTDVFRVRGSEWQVSYGGTSSWTRLGSSGVPANQLRLGDLNGDGKTDIFRAGSGKWFVSYGGTERWTELGSSGYPISSLHLGDLNGDGTDDVIHISGSRVQVSYGGRSRWTTVATNGPTPTPNNERIGLERVPSASIQYAIADFDGDGSDDILASNGVCG